MELTIISFIMKHILNEIQNKNLQFLSSYFLVYYL